MMQRPNLKLIKDFKEGAIVLYWLDDDANEQVSPDFNSMTLAEEWYRQFQFDLYEGTERRTSHIDRRRLVTTRTNMHRSKQIASHLPDGRRYTDRDIMVDEDKSRVSMMQYYARNLHLLEGDE